MGGEWCGKERTSDEVITFAIQRDTNRRVRLNWRWGSGGRYICGDEAFNDSLLKVER